MNAGSRKLKLAVLISGSGSNLQAIIDACATPDFPAIIEVVISNVPDAYGLERASHAAIPRVVVDHRNFENRTSFEDALQDELGRYEIDLICLAGFMRILTADFVNAWPKKIINTHPSLLPRHGGKGMFGHHVHEAVLAAGEKTSGCSIHYVIPDVDQGPVILQKTVPVEATDTPEILATRVLQEEHKAYPEAIRLLAAQISV
jgi:phosphoribosylglycinamide formyltransferase-1